MRCEIPHRCVRRKYRIRRHSPFSCATVGRGQAPGAPGTGQTEKSSSVQEGQAQQGGGLAQEADVHRYKVVITGMARAGKTSLWQKILKNRCPEKYEPTVKAAVGAKTMHLSRLSKRKASDAKELDETESIVHLSIWDLPPVEPIIANGRTTASLLSRKSSFRDADAVIICIDASKAWSSEKLDACYVDCMSCLVGLDHNGTAKAKQPDLWIALTFSDPGSQKPLVKPTEPSLVDSAAVMGLQGAFSISCVSGDGVHNMLKQISLQLLAKERASQAPAEKSKPQVAGAAVTPGTITADPKDLQPVAPQTQSKIFGVPLMDVVRADRRKLQKLFSNRKRDTRALRIAVPEFLGACCRFLRKCCVDVPGLLVDPHDDIDSRMLELAVSQLESLHHSVSVYATLSATCTPKPALAVLLLKKFLKEVPGRLLPSGAFISLITSFRKRRSIYGHALVQQGEELEDAFDASSSVDARVLEIRQVIWDLKMVPQSNRRSLFTVFRMLNYASSFSERNFTSISALATVYGLCICPWELTSNVAAFSADENSKGMTSAEAIRSMQVFLEDMIAHAPMIFARRRRPDINSSVLTVPSTSHGDSRSIDDDSLVAQSDDDDELEDFEDVRRDRRRSGRDESGLFVRRRGSSSAASSTDRGALTSSLCTVATPSRADSPVFEG